MGSGLGFGILGFGFGRFEHMSLPGCPSVTPFIISQGEKGGVVLTYVSTWLCLCHSSHGKVRRGGGGFNICLYLALPLSLHSSYDKVRGGVF